MSADNAELERYFDEMNRENALKAHAENGDRCSEARKAAVDSANVAIRAMLLVNGGAVIALLALVGALENGSNGTNIQLESLVAPIRWFAFGVGLSALTAGFAYLVNLLDSDIFSSVRLTWDHPYIEEKPLANRLRPFRGFAHVLALILALTSISAFFAGIYTTTKAISSLGI